MRSRINGFSLKVKTLFKEMIVEAGFIFKIFASLLVAFSFENETN